MTADSNTKNLGLTVTDGANPVISVTPGSISEAKLVTGSTVKTYIDTTALAEGGSIAQKIAEAKQAAIDSAKVTLTAGTGITIPNSGTAQTAFTVSVDTDVIATKQSVDDLSGLVSGLPATIKAAQDAADAAMAEAQAKVASVSGPATGLVTVTGDKDVTITVSDTIATKSDITTEINKLSATDGIITTLTTRVGEAEANAAASASAASASEAAAKSAQSASETAASNASASKTAAEGAQSAAEAAASDAATSASAAQAAQSAAEGSATSASQSASAASAAQSAAEAAQAAAEAAQAVVETTAKWEAGTDEELGKFSDETASGVVTGTTVKTVADEVLTLAKAYSKGLHTTSVTYHVTETLPTVPAGKEEEYKGRIYLVTTGKDGVVAADGSRIEYMYVNEGTEEAPSWDWEQIGTTTADLAGYASTVATGQATTLANQGSVYGHIADDGTLTLGVASATDSVMGVSKMFTGDDITSVVPKSDTAVSLHTAQMSYYKLAALASGKVSSVTAGNGDALTGLSVSVDNTDATAPTISVTNGVINSGSLPATAKVVANGLIDGTDVIETEKINFGEGISSYISSLTSNSPTLTTWVGDMPNLQSGYNMFAAHSALESFIGDLSSLTYGASMFYSCGKLTSFIGDLSSLTDGYTMFSNTMLSPESVECIADTINEYGGHIGISWKTLPEEDKRQELVDALSRIVDKGWTLYTNQALTPLFNSEKYQTGYDTVQPLDLDSEPQTVYYVVKK